MANYHPFKSAFRLHLELCIMDRFSGRISPTSTSIVIDDQTYSTSDIGYVDAKVEFDNAIAHI